MNFLGLKTPTRAPQLLETPHLLVALEHGLISKRLAWEFIAPWAYRLAGKKRDLYLDFNGTGIRLTLDGEVRDFYNDESQKLRTQLQSHFAEEILAYKSQAIDEVTLFLDQLGEELNLEGENSGAQSEALPGIELLRLRLPSAILEKYRGPTKLSEVILETGAGSEDPALVIALLLEQPWEESDLAELKEISLSACKELRQTNVAPPPTYIVFRTPGDHNVR